MKSKLDEWIFQQLLKLFNIFKQNLFILLFIHTKEQQVQSQWR